MRLRWPLPLATTIAKRTADQQSVSFFRYGCSIVVTSSLLHVSSSMHGGQLSIFVTALCRSVAFADVPAPSPPHVTPQSDPAPRLHYEAPSANKWNDPTYLSLAPSAVSQETPSDDAASLYNTSNYTLPQALIGDNTLGFRGFGVEIIGGGGGGGGGGDDGGGHDAFPRLVRGSAEVA